MKSSEQIKSPNVSNDALEAKVAAMLGRGPAPRVKPLKARPAPQVCPINVVEFETSGNNEDRPSSSRVKFLYDPPQSGRDNGKLAAFGSGGAYDPHSVSIPTNESVGSYPPGGLSSHDGEYEPREVVIGKNGLPRQAGADMPEGEYLKRFKKRAEQSLFIFLKGVLGRFFLTPHFHKEVCGFIQKCPPFRKLVLMPREHAKTTIVAGGLPPHILIQPAETNIYFPGIEGSECRILLSGETEGMAKKNLRVIQSVFDENKIFRAFWPHRVWEGRAKSQSKMWSDSGVIIPRKNEWPDPTIRAVGVGGAITGARPNVLIKDDLVSFKAANSEVVMDEAIDWHRASRALLDKYEIESGLSSLEFLIGCLVADSIVTMDDGARRRICDVEVGEYVHAPTLNGAVWRRKVLKVIPQGIAETWTISTTTHDIRSTGNHPFLISTGTDELSWKRADQLREGDLVVAHKKLYSYPSGEGQSFEGEFCWLFGFMLGDGWVNTRPRKGYVCFSPGVDADLNQRVLDALRAYVPGNKWYLTLGSYYRTDSVKAAKFFSDLGFKGGAKTKRLPLWAYRLPQEQKLAFLRGFCDADGGWVSHQTWRVEISNRELLEDLRHLACLCGVRTGRLLTRERVLQPPHSKYPIRAVCHSAGFNFSTIDRPQRVNKNLYGGLNVGRDTKLSDELRFERVTSVVRNKVAEQVWDLTVEGEPAFFANGLAVHNTRWAVYDLYSHIIDNDPSVEVIDAQYHKIISDGKILWREKYTLEDIEQLRVEHGANFYLLYLNSAADPELTDFDMSLVRDFHIHKGEIVFEEDERDAMLAKRLKKQKRMSDVGSGVNVPPPKMERGSVLDNILMQRFAEAGGGIRLRGI